MRQKREKENRFAAFWEAVRGFEKRRPTLWKILVGFLFSALLLFITDIVYRVTFHHAAALDPRVFDVKIPAIDDKIPVVPVFFFGYIWSYIYWFFAPFFILRTKKEKIVDFFLSYVITTVLCGLILYVYPTKLDRVAEGLWDPAHKGFFWDLLHICYNVDGGFVEYNLFPSLHCANSVLYYQALQSPAVPRKIQMAALFSTVLVVVSTLFTKQHFFIDAVGGVLFPILIRAAVAKAAPLLRKAAGTEAPDGKG